MVTIVLLELSNLNCIVPNRSNTFSMLVRVSLTVRLDIGESLSVGVCYADGRRILPCRDNVFNHLAALVRAVATLLGKRLGLTLVVECFYSSFTLYERIFLLYSTIRRCNANLHATVLPCVILIEIDVQIGIQTPFALIYLRPTIISHLKSSMLNPSE